MADAGFWTDQAAAQKVMQRRKRLEGDLELLKRLARPGGRRQGPRRLAGVGGGRGGRLRLRPRRPGVDRGGGRVPEDAGGRPRPGQRHPHDQRRRRRHRQPGLGGDAPADVPPLVRAPGLRSATSPTSRPARRPGSRAPPSWSRASTPTATSPPRPASTGWCASSPFDSNAPAADLLRLGLRLARDRRDDRDRHPGRRTSGSTPTARAGRAASTST